MQVLPAAAFHAVVRCLSRRHQAATQYVLAHTPCPLLNSSAIERRQPNPSVRE
jgi:hypothetical protein